MTVETMATFFGWCTVINIGIYVLTVIALALMRDWVARFNARLFGIGGDDVLREGFRYVGHYKLAITVFCFVPWLALTIMS